MNQQIFDKISQLMSNLFEIDKDSIKPESTFESLDLTSLDAIDLIVELQQRTGKKVDEEAVKQIRTIADIVALVETYPWNDEQDEKNQDEKKV